MNEKIQSLMKKLDISEAEAREILAYDEDVDKGKKTEFDLTPEQEKSTRKYRQAERKQTAYNFTKRERKPDLEKRQIIEEIADFLSEKDGFDVSIIKKEREISLIVGSNDYSITLIKHRPPKK
jgi:hypothetical protein